MCRKAVFKSIVNYVEVQNKVNNIVIGGNFNQDIVSLDIQEVYIKLGIKDIYQYFNYIEVEDLDRTFWYGSKSIDSVVATLNILQCVEGSKLLEINEVVRIDCRSYLIDINLEMYFDKEFWDRIR